MPIPYIKKADFRIREISKRIVGRNKGGKSKKIWKRITSNWVPILVIAVIIMIIVGVGVFAWFSRDLPDPNKILDRSLAQSTKIYARDEQTLLYEIHGPEKRTLVELQDIPKHMIQATIAIEDHDFYRHQGFDLGGVVKAICHQIFGTLGGLCPQRGGSTITQQLVKNSILTSEKTYTRKVKELVLAYQLERKFTKDQILQMYLNEIPYGSSAYGVESATNTFFGKSAKDLSLAESAMLAALPQLPTYYSPYGNHTDDLSNRLHLVLNEMVKQKFITEEQAEEAKQVNLLERLKPKYETIAAPHFVMYVKELLTEKYGEKMVEQGGLKVITTLDYDKQKAAESAIEKYADRNQRQYNASNASLVSLDTKTGQVLAMVGSRDYFDESIDGQVNVALRPRQPGSSFKPFVYATAFAKGFTPETILFDLVTKFKTDTRDYEPHNYDNGEHGPLPMRQTLAGSLNIPAVKTLYLAGIDNVLDLAQKLGYTTFEDRSRFGLSIVLGGAEVKLLEHVSAFATLAREGIRHPVAVVLKVESKDGKILEEFENREEKIIDQKVAQQINSILSDNNARSFIFGSSNYLTLPDRPVAAKTGTTNDYHDAWTMGYTPSIATGVWVGNSNNDEMRRGADGSIVAAPIWQEYMKMATRGPVEAFHTPPLNSADKPILQGKIGADVVTKIDKYTGLIIPDSCLTTYPPEFIEEKKFGEVHNILYYINKDDPGGPPPSDPTSDPQYNNWEEPVKRWAQQNNYVEKRPAVGDCNIRADENKPVISITVPVNGATVSTVNIIVQSAVTSPRPIKKVVYYLDDKVIGESQVAPFTLAYDSAGLENGFHDLKAEAYDDINNKSSTSITINYLISSSSVIPPG